MREPKALGELTRTSSLAITLIDVLPVPEHCHLNDGDYPAIAFMRSVRRI